jgi:hypothetical protein
MADPFFVSLVTSSISSRSSSPPPNASIVPSASSPAPPRSLCASFSSSLRLAGKLPPSLACLVRAWWGWIRPATMLWRVGAVLSLRLFQSQDFRSRCLRPFSFTRASLHRAAVYGLKVLVFPIPRRRRPHDADAPMPAHPTGQRCDSVRLLAGSLVHREIISAH